MRVEILNSLAHFQTPSTQHTHTHTQKEQFINILTPASRHWRIFTVSSRLGFRAPFIGDNLTVRDSENGGGEAVERDIHKAREAEAQGLPRRFLRPPLLHQQGLLLLLFFSISSPNIDEKF